MRLHPRTQPANIARAKLAYDVWKLIADADLTDAEALQAVAEVQAGLVKGLLRAGRHPGHGSDECKAGEACEVAGCPGNWQGAS